MTHMLINKPILLPRMRKLLTLPLDPTKTHPLAGKLQMMAGLCSGKDWECQAFRRDLSASYYPVGDKAQKSNITRITKNAWTLQVAGTSIPLIRHVLPNWILITTVLVLMHTGLQTVKTFQRLLINVVEIKYFEHFTQIVGLFVSLKQFDCL